MNGRGPARVRAWLGTPSGRIALLVVVGTVFVGLGANMVRRAHEGSSAFKETYRYTRDLVYGGENVYDPALNQWEGTHSKYPPFFFVFAAPFAALPLHPAAWLWYLANLLAALVASWWSVKAFRPPGAGPPGPVTAWLPLLLVAALVVSNLGRGQVNLIVTAIVCGGVYLASRKRDYASGAALGAAAALKLTPGLLIVYFLWKRQWRVAVGAVAALVVCWGLLPLLVLGPERAAEATGSWTQVVAGIGQEGAASESLGGFRSTNQSLSAAAHRYFTEVPAVAARGDRPALYVNLTSLDPTAPHVRHVVLGVSLALLVGLALLTRGRLRDEDRRSMVLGLEVSLVTIAILVVSPISWINHFVALLLPFAAAVETARRLPPGGPERRRLVLGIAVACALVTSGVAVLPLTFSVPLAGALWLLFALARERRLALRGSSPPAP